MRTHSLLVFIGAMLATSGAHAQARVPISVEGPEGAILEEQPRGSEEWRRLCDLPCDTTVEPEPLAKHRIVDRQDRREIRVAPAPGGQRAIVRYERATSGRPVMIAGAVVGAAGLLTAGAGFFVMINEVASGVGRDPDPERPRSGGNDSVGVKLLAAGGIGLGLGVVMLLIGVIQDAPSSVSVRVAKLAAARTPLGFRF